MAAWWPCDELWALGQELIEMAAPARRVLAAAQPLRLGGVEHALDPPAQARRRLPAWRARAASSTPSTSSVVILLTGRWRSRAASWRSDRLPLPGVLAAAPGRPHGLDRRGRRSRRTKRPPTRLWPPLGCAPPPAGSRACEASSRALASGTSRAEPKPISVGLPCQRNKNVQRRPPTLGETER